MALSVVFSKDSLATLLPYWECRCINEPGVIFLGMSMQTVSIVHFSPLHLTVAKPPANLIAMAHESLHDVTRETIDFLHITEFIRAIAHNLPGFQATVIEQVCQSPFAFVRKQVLDNVPELVSLIFVLRCRLFHVPGV